MAMEHRAPVEEVKWSAEELDITPRPNGPGLAVLLAAAIGVFLLGVFTTWSEASPGVADAMTLQKRVGPLSGKVTFSGLAFVVTWAALAISLWRKNLPWTPVLVAAGVLIAAGFVGTFPKFFQLFE